MVRRRRIRHAGAGSSTDAPRDRWPWLRPAYRERQTIRPFAGRGELLPFPQTLHHPAYRTDPNSTATTDNSRAKKKQNCRTICERSHRSPQPQRPNVVSEWARKRKRTGSHIERVRTDAGCRGEALTQSQSDSDVCTGLSRHRQFADLAERLRHENGKMICCPADRILHGEGGSGAKNHPPEKCGCALRRFSTSSRNCALLRRA